MRLEDDVSRDAAGRQPTGRPIFSAIYKKANKTLEPLASVCKKMVHRGSFVYILFFLFLFVALVCQSLSLPFSLICCLWSSPLVISNYTSQQSTMDWILLHGPVVSHCALSVHVCLSPAALLALDCLPSSADGALSRPGLSSLPCSPLNSSSSRHIH